MAFKRQDNVFARFFSKGPKTLDFHWLLLSDLPDSLPLCLLCLSKMVLQFLNNFAALSNGKLAAEK